MEIYLICHKGYDPDIHIVDWKGCDLLPKYSTIDEEWRPVTTRLGRTLYASNLGRIHSHLNRHIRLHKNLGGYIKTSFDGLCEYVHRLVYQAFNPDADISNCVINHLDSQRDNNRLDNLEAVSHCDNMLYAYSYGIGAVMLGRIDKAYVPEHKKHISTSEWKF